ncbi:DMT family transporter [Gorillibacterium timonense]|uniref:DMT family transporter n=1 Tax=Gorillibacterium timonense TaxID=1689269 RepID=UPI00071E3776|nr:EamA family transporter [Gorillibacterium timonense]
MQRQDTALLFLLASIWGASFLFMRIASPVLGPFFTTEVRVGVAGVALLLYAALRGKLPRLRDRWKAYLILGGLNAAIPFVLICTAELHLNASLAAILNATTPLFTALVVWGWTRERLGRGKAVGMVIGLAGVAILVGWSPLPLNGETVLAILFSLLAALAYGFGTTYAGRAFRGVAPLEVAIGQQLAAAILLLPFALYEWPRSVPPSNVIYSLLGLSLLCTALAYLIFYRLMERVGAVKTVTVTFLVPIFGILWGVLFLNESVYVTTVIGLLVILMSIVLVNQIPLPARLKRKPKEERLELP